MTDPADTTQVDIRIRKLLEDMIDRNLEDEMFMYSRVPRPSIDVGDAIFHALYTTLVQQ